MEIVIAMLAGTALLAIILIVLVVLLILRPHKLSSGKARSDIMKIKKQIIDSDKHKNL